MEVTRFDKLVNYPFGPWKMKVNVFGVNKCGRIEAGNEYFQVRRRPVREAHVRVIAQHILREDGCNVATQDRAPIATLNEEALVTQTDHEIAQHNRHFNWTKTRLGGSLRKSVSWQTGHNDFKHQIVMFTCGRQFGDDLVELAHRSRPSMNEQQRNNGLARRCLGGRFHMNEMHV